MLTAYKKNNVTEVHTKYIARNCLVLLCHNCVYFDKDQLADGMLCTNSDREVSDQFKNRVFITETNQMCGCLSKKELPNAS